MKSTRITALIAVAMAFTIITGCDNQVKSPATYTDVPSSIPTDIIKDSEPTTPAGNVTPDAQETDETKKFTISLEGIDEEVEMTKFTGDFTDIGGPLFNIYGDTSRYEYVDDGMFRFVLPELKDSVYLDIKFHPGKNAADVVPGLLDSYESTYNLNDEGEVELGEHVARYVHGQGEKHYLEGYVIELADGCVSLVISAPEGYTEGHAARLYYMAKTITID